MTNSTIIHRPISLVVAAATGLSGVLLAATLNSAQAMPEPDAPPAAPVDTTHFVEHGCFITPLSWNEALDGPLPRCYSYLP